MPDFEYVLVGAGMAGHAAARGSARGTRAGRISA
jgi:hypothetical protein